MFKSKTIYTERKIVASDNFQLYQVARLLLEQTVGLDITNEQEANTPRRFVESLIEMTTPEPFKFTVFTPDHQLDEMVIERDIPFFSLCRHHVLPFTGVAHIAYVPDKTMAGISKLARTVKFHAAGLRTQEELTVQIADFLETRLQPLGVGVIMEATHTCMTLRGVKAPGTLTYTAAMKGVFADHDRTAKSEFLNRIGNTYHV